MRSSSHPPKPAQRFLEWALPHDVRGASIKGDLDQEYRERRARRSGTVPDLWYVLEALKLGIRFLLARLLSGTRRLHQRSHGPDRAGPLTRFREETRLGLRLLTRSPWLTAFAVMAMGLGIGVTATTFSFTHALLRELPFPDPHELVNLSWEDAESGSDKLRLNAVEFTAWREKPSTLEELAAFRETVVDLSDDAGEPEQISAAYFTSNLFLTLGVQPVLGRGFLPEEEGPHRHDVALLSHALWNRRYAADPAILGRTVRVNGVERTVVGVMPEGFHFPQLEDLWFPLPLDPTDEATAASRRLATVGRIRDGVPFGQAEAEFRTLAGQLALEGPEEYGTLRLRFRNYRAYLLGEQASPMLRGLLILISFVLLIACASVANLLLARAAQRSRELAVQVALGAGRRRIIGQVLAESLVISALGGGLGVAVAYLGTALMRKGLEAEPIPFSWMSLEVDATVLAFSVGLVFLASLLAGVMPGIRASRVDVNQVLKDEGRGSTGLRMGRLSRALVISEVGLSCALLIVAGLMSKGPLDWSRSDPGFEKEGMFTGAVTLRSVPYPEDAEVLAFQAELLQRLRAIPGVTQGALSDRLPGLRGYILRLQLEGAVYERDEDLERTRGMTVGPEFFETVGVTLSAGRPFSPSDNADAPPVVIVNESFARRHFPQGSPLGRQIRVGRIEEESPWRTVVGVAPDLTMEGPPRVEGGGIYLPLLQLPRRNIDILLRTAGDPLAITPSVRRIVAELDQDLPVVQVNTLEKTIIQDMTAEFVISGLLVASGATALVLAAIGLFGILAFTVQSRTREIGIRMALGAESRRVLWGTLRSGLIQIGMGLIVGAALALLMASMLSGLFPNTHPLDRTVWGLVMTIMVATGFLASWIPALRAVRTNPVSALGGG